MKQSLKINISRILTGEGIELNSKITIFQPTIKDIVILGNERFGNLYTIWNLSRKDLVPEETDETWNLEDWDVYKKFIIYDLNLQKIFKDSVLFFMHKKVEFLKMQNSIFIGELESGIELTEELFSEIQSVIKQITSQKEEDINIQNAPRSKRAQEVHDKIVKGQQRLAEIKKEKGEDDLASQIVAVVAHGHSYETVYNMTLLQFRAVLEKIVQIENYQIACLLSPYADKKHKSKTKHWLE